MMLWWNVFTVLDVLLLLIYNQLGPRAVFFVNNVIWFLGLDLYHLYFTIALWTSDVPSIKEVPQKIPFYPLKPTNLEPRRPKLENNDTANACGAEAPNPNTIEESPFDELYNCNATCEFQNPSLKKRPGWKGKGGRRVAKRKVTGQNDQETQDNKQDIRAKTNETNEQENITSKTNFTYIFKKPLPSVLPTVSD